MGGQLVLIKSVWSSLPVYIFFDLFKTPTCIFLSLNPFLNLFIEWGEEA